MVKRWLSGIILGAVTMGCLLAGGYWWAGLLIVGLSLAAAEWADLGNCSPLVIGLVVLVGFVLIFFGLPDFLPLLLFIPLSVIIWSNIPDFASHFTWSSAGLLWLSYPFYFALELRHGIEIGNNYIIGSWLLGILIVATILQNTFAYYTGLFVGTRSTFFAGLSPNKSTAGFLGGLWGVLLIFILAAYLEIFPLPLALIFALGLGVAGPAGDLLISAFKRNRDLDDTGAIIPGHGGVLDRIDSLLANTIVFYLLLNISGYLS